MSIFNRKKKSMTAELEEYRNLLPTPEHFEDGFNIKTVMGAFFCGLIMLPGSIYLGLVAGQSMGPAASWVTLILFTEIARRSFSTMKKQEIYILLYISGGVIGIAGSMMGWPFGALIWNQYFVGSTVAKAFGLTGLMPKWVVPHPDSPAIINRTFFHKDWFPPLLFMVCTYIISKLSWFTGGYILFRITSDIEKLAFPYAPLNVAGALSLAESGEKKETWRWRVFSIGAMIGVTFGIIYVGVPAITGALFNQPLQVIPIPWVDLMKSTENILPAAPFGFTLDLGMIFIGFLLPFWVVVGTFIAIMMTIFVNPLLYNAGILHTWQKGMDTVMTTFSNSIDFWMSIDIGVGLAVAIIGIAKVVSSIKAAKQKDGYRRDEKFKIPAGRGDFPVWIAAAIFAVATAASIALCLWLVPGFPWYYFLFFGLIYTPLISFVNAQMIGIAGQFVEFPMVREGVFLLGSKFSGYQGIGIWYAPIPMANHGATAQQFREVELSGTKFTSLIKAELMMFPVVLGCGLLFWQFIWKMAPIPSVVYPYVMKFWPLMALNQALWFSSTTGQGSMLFFQALKPVYIACGFSFGLIAYSVLALFGLPILLIFGLIRGMGQLPHFMFPEIVGAMLGRFYFMKKFGKEKWMQYTPVLLAGFACGMGLIGMAGVAIALISKSVSQLPF